MIGRKFNDRAQFFSMYLVIATLFMCAVVIGMFYLQNSSISSSLVSPSKILELKNEYYFFEKWENETIKEAMKNTAGKWGEKKTSAIKDRFCLEFIQEEHKEFTDFIFKDMVYAGRSDWGNAFSSLESRDNFCMSIYDFSWSSDKKLLINRKSFGKTFTLFADNRSKINFVVDFEWDLQKNMVVSEEDIKASLNAVCPAIAFDYLGDDATVSKSSSYIFYGSWSDSDVYLSKTQKNSFEQGLNEILYKKSLEGGFDIRVESGNKVIYDSSIVKNEGEANLKKIGTDIKNLLGNICKIN